jgi:hypothetical protein
MKKSLLTLLCIVFALTGCTTLLDAYQMKYDANEYQMITEIRANAGRFGKQCEQSSAAVNAAYMADLTELFEKYSEYLPHNSNGYHSAQLLNEMAHGLEEKYHAGVPVNDAFCRIKYSSIENSARLLQTVIGNKPR